MHLARSLDKPTYTPRDPKPICRCRHCGHRIEPKPQPHRIWINIVVAFYRESGGYRDHYLRDDVRGRAFLLALLVLNLPSDVVEQLAPWITLHELGEIRKQAALIELTTVNVSQIIQLTKAQRAKYGWRVKDGKRIKRGLLTFPACDETTEQAELRRKADKNATRRARRAARAELIARCPDPREAVVRAVADRIRQRPGANVISARAIMDGMSKAERDAFPASETSFRVIVYRVIGRLDDGDRRLLCDAPTSQRFVTPTPHAKPLIHQDLAVTLRGSQQSIAPDHDRDTGNVVLLRPKPVKAGRRISCHPPLVVVAPVSPTSDVSGSSTPQAAFQGGDPGFVPVLHPAPSLWEASP